MSDDIRQQLESHGFRAVYESTAVTIFAHPGAPGLDLRVGTNYVVANRNGKELYRAQRRMFDLQDFMRRVGLHKRPAS